MVLINNNHAINVSATEIYNNCFKDVKVKDFIMYDNDIIVLYMWLPSIETIDVSTDETIIRLKDEKEEINLGFTGYEWVFDVYINTLCEKEGEN